MNSTIGVNIGNKTVSIRLSDHKGLIKRLVEKLRQFLRNSKEKEIHKKAGRFINSKNSQEKINIFQYFKKNAADVHKDKFTVKLNDNELSLHLGTEQQKITLDENQTAMLALVKKEDFLSTLQSFYKFNNKENTSMERVDAFFELRDMSDDQNKERFDLNIEDNDHLSLSIKLPGYPYATQEETIKTTLKMGTEESEISSRATKDINKTSEILKGPENQIEKQSIFDFKQVKLDFIRNPYYIIFSDESMLLSKAAESDSTQLSHEYTCLDATEPAEVLKNKLTNISDKQKCAINLLLTQGIFGLLVYDPIHHPGEEPIAMTSGTKKTKYFMKQVDNDTFRVTLTFDGKVEEEELEHELDTIIETNGGICKQNLQMDFLLKGDKVICVGAPSEKQYLPGYPVQKSAEDYPLSQKI